MLADRDNAKYGSEEVGIQGFFCKMRDKYILGGSLPLRKDFDIDNYDMHGFVYIVVVIIISN